MDAIEASDEMQAGLLQLKIDKYQQRSEWQSAVESHSSLYQQRFLFEMALSELIVAHPLLIHCPVCADVSSLQLSQPAPKGANADWREAGICSKCGLNCRVRLGLALLLDAVRGKSEQRLYFTEQTTPCFLRARQLFEAVVGSEFVPDAERQSHLSDYLKLVLGDADAALRHEDLTQLSFHDESFDAIGCFEVLEHVPDYRKALLELYRILKPGGRVVISVPFLPAADSTLVRAEMDAEGHIHHLLPAEYHGDPVAGDGVLCFYHFAWDLLDRLRECGFQRVDYVHAWSPAMGLLGSAGLIVAER